MKNKRLTFPFLTRQKVNSLAVRAKVKSNSIAAILKEARGDQNSSTAGLAILAVIVVGLAVVWAKSYFPDFMTNIGDKINGLFDL